MKKQGQFEMEEALLLFDKIHKSNQVYTLKHNMRLKANGKAMRD